MICPSKSICLFACAVATILCQFAGPSQAVAVEPRDVHRVAEKLLAKWDRTPEAIELKHVFSTNQFSSRALICIFSPDGAAIAFRLRDGTVHVLDATSGAMTWTWPNAKGAKGVGLIQFSGDGRRIAVGVPDEGIELWDHKENRLVAKVPVKGHATPVGESHHGEAMFVRIMPKTFSPEDAQSADPKVLVAGNYQLSLATGEATPIRIPEMNMVTAIHPIPGHAGYVAVASRLQLLAWNPSVDATRATYVAIPGRPRNRPKAKRSTNGFVPRVYMNSEMAIVAINARGTLVPMQKLLAEVDALQRSDNVAEVNLPEILSLGYVRDRDLEMGPTAWLRISPDGRRFFTSERLVTAFAFDLCEFGVTPDEDKMEFKATRSLDMSRDCRRVVMADDEGEDKSTIRMFELGKIPDPPAREVNQWARKAIADNDDELVDAVLASADKRKTLPREWGVTFSSNRSHGSPWKQAVIGMLTNRWAPAWMIKDENAVAAWQSRKGIELPSIAQIDAEDLELSLLAEAPAKREAQKQRQEAARKIATHILESENPTPQDIKAFIDSCPDAPPGRELLIKIAARAAIICKPDDSSLVEIANGLLEYAFEKPDDPAIEPTVGLIEAVANAESARNGADAGDAAYAAFTVAVQNANFRKFMTGRERSRDPRQTSQEFLENTRHRHQLARQYLDYERLVRGFQVHLAAKPNDLRAARLALELGYAANDKGLARLAIPCLENSPRVMQGPPIRAGKIKAYLDWAKSP